MKKYILGSTLLGLNHCRDTDYLILVDIENYYKRVREGEFDIVYRSIDNMMKYLNFEIDVCEDKGVVLYNYQLDSKIIKQDFPISYSILDYKKELLQAIGKVIKWNLYNFNERVTAKGRYCMKNIYHIAYNLFIILNNSVTLTEEQMNIVQKIHDCEMPIQYLKELRQLYNILVKRENIKE